MYMYTWRVTGVCTCACVCLLGTSNRNARPSSASKSLNNRSQQHGSSRKKKLGFECTTRYRVSLLLQGHPFRVRLQGHITRARTHRDAIDLDYYDDDQHHRSTTTECLGMITCDHAERESIRSAANRSAVASGFAAGLGPEIELAAVAEAAASSLHQ